MGEKMTEKIGFRFRKLKMDKRAVSPAISTVIITSAVVILVLSAVVFANNQLYARIAENEFGAMKQFMQTVGLQMDDVAWIPGRTQTIRYASRFGQVSFVNSTLQYAIYVNKGAGYVSLANYTAGILLFNMPVSKYTLGNNYFERIFPLNNSFVQMGASAPVSHVFVVEKLPMTDGDYVRVVAAPVIRMLNSTIVTGEGTTNYFKFYLPTLSSGTNPYYSQSVTLMGKSVSVETENSVNAVRIQVSFLNWTQGFGADFFRFNNLTEEIDVPDGSVIEFYIGEVAVSLGLYP
jgi:hypothetical protein